MPSIDWICGFVKNSWSKLSANVPSQLSGWIWSVSRICLNFLESLRISSGGPELSKLGANAIFEKSEEIDDSNLKDVDSKDMIKEQ